jgi:hypothetical protein
MVVVRPYTEKARIEPMSPSTFRTFVDKNVAVFKQKYDEKGEPFDVIRTINKETAQGVMDCDDFWIGLREILSVNPVPTPVIETDGGSVKLLTPGYDEVTKTLTFGWAA